jgi:CubicO group peptidase (beta-lactamase class C family)
MHQSGIERIDVPDSALEIVRNNHENYILLHASNVTSAGPTEFAYRNENFIILGEIVEQFSGVLYEDFILSNIVEPLRMVGPTFPLDDRRHKVAVPYLNVDFDTWWNSETEIPPTAFDEFHHVAPVYKPTAAGGLLLTAVDMVKFLQWIAHDERDDVSRISELCLSSALQRGYIRGCSLRSNEDVTRVGHNGSTAGVHARAYHYVERDIDIVVLSNHDGQASSIFRSLEAVILDQKTNK